MGYLSNFERGQIVRTCLAAASVTKTAVLLCVSRATVYMVTSAYTNHAYPSSAERNSGWNSTLIERNRRTLGRIFVKKSQYCSRGRTAKLIIRLEDPVSTKLPNVSFKNATSTIGLQLQNLWLLQVMLRCVNDGVTTIKPGHQTSGNARTIWSHEPSFTLLPASGRVYVWRTHKKAYNSEFLVPTMKQGGRFCDSLGSNIVVQYSVGPIITRQGRTTVTEYLDRLDIQVHPMIQTLFSNNVVVFQDDNAQSHIWNCSVIVWRAWRRTSTSYLASIITRVEHHWITLGRFGD
jgi:hypothetical protein